MLCFSQTVHAGLACALDAVSSQGVSNPNLTQILAQVIEFYNLLNPRPWA